MKNAKYDISWVHSSYQSWLFETKYCAPLCGSFYSFFFFSDHWYELSAVATECFFFTPSFLSLFLFFPPFQTMRNNLKVTMKERKILNFDSSACACWDYRLAWPPLCSAEDRTQSFLHACILPTELHIEIYNNDLFLFKKNLLLY